MAKYQLNPMLEMSNEFIRKTIKTSLKKRPVLDKLRDGSVVGFFKPSKTLKKASKINYLNKAKSLPERKILRDKWKTLSSIDKYGELL